jgi:sigma-B regulation protein RsbU (phosphoserine phosphatase)
LLRAGEVTRLPASGVPLGLFEESVYEELPFVMEKGDILVFASDGATDAMDPDGKAFDETSFMNALRRHGSEHAAQLANRLYQEICEFTRSADVHDDITILALRRSA